MKTFNISVAVSGYEYYTVTAEDDQDAIQQIKDGDAYLQSSEVEWSDDFIIDSVEDV